MILHLTIRFLDSRYHGRGDGGVSEWPPSPFRVFQSLLAGAKARWSDARARAFEWLQALPPPVIYAPKAREASSVLTYVPNNNENAARTPKCIRPRILVRPHVEYLWTFDPTAADARRHADTIADCARQIRCVGWGIDMAVGCAAIRERPVSAEPGTEMHVPAEGDGFAGALARVPCAGSLKSLEDAYESFLNRIRTNPVTGAEEIHDSPGIMRFDVRAYASAPTRPYCAFDLCKPDDEDEQTSFNPRQIKVLVGMIRGLLGSDRVWRAMQDVCDVDAMLLGHPKDEDSPRLSILPLLSVGHQHSDARVRRVILAEPFGGDGTVCRLLAELLNGQLLQNTTNSRREAILVRLPHNDRHIRRWYSGSAQQWASVSPVLLPGFDHRIDKREGRHRPQNGAATLARAEKLTLKALAHAGIAQPCRVELSSVSWWPGVPHARDFVPRDKLGPAPRCHVKLTFDQPFTGPLSLGRQRHMGMGVFAALNSILDGPR